MFHANTVSQARCGSCTKRRLVNSEGAHTEPPLVTTMSWILRARGSGVLCLGGCRLPGEPQGAAALPGDSSRGSKGGGRCPGRVPTPLTFLTGRWPELPRGTHPSLRSLGAAGHPASGDRHPCRPQRRVWMLPFVFDPKYDRLFRTGGTRRD